MTSKILSCMSIVSMRDSRFFFTFASWPEYVWTTYHCPSSVEMPRRAASRSRKLVRAIASSPALRADLLQQGIQRGQQRVREAKQETDGDRDTDNDNRQVPCRLAIRPRDLAQLGGRVHK